MPIEGAGLENFAPGKRMLGPEDEAVEGETPAGTDVGRGRGKQRGHIWKEAGGRDRQGCGC